MHVLEKFINTFQDSPLGIETGHKLDGPHSVPGKAKIFLFSIVSKPALGPTNPPIQWVPGAIPRRQSDRGEKLTIRLHPVSRPGMVELHLHSPMGLHSKVFNYLRIGQLCLCITVKSLYYGDIHVYDFIVLITKTH
jgi:hypothetical protein